ncbi:class I SAM-dependent methyltransferase [Hyphococcus sp. DH-69]|uniref:class I SAM-dependent methyltransferase n=1 Tax=Hyphococcus formosus TaxID=3143534 RepID=UPI00398B71E0
MNTPPEIFDRSLIAKRRSWAARTFGEYDFLHQRAMDDIVDRLETVMRDFPKSVFSGVGNLANKLTPDCKIGEIVHLDPAPARLPANGLRVVADEELLPIAPESQNLFVSLLTLHSVNDLIGALVQIRRSLVQDGLFIAAVFAEETLSNLRKALYTAETEITGGVSPRINPFASIQDYGQALSRAGFTLPVVDIDKVSVTYDEPIKLFRDLRGMGETSALKNRAGPLRRDVLMRAIQIFAENGGMEKFEIVYLTGWAPDPSQQKPLKPGSGKVSLEDAIKGAK